MPHIYPEGGRAEIGERRWVVKWYTLPASFAPGDDVEYDDMVLNERAYPTRAKARAAARKIVASGKTALGCAQYQEQVVDWFVREDNIAEWAEAGEAEEICWGDVAAV